MNYVAKDDPNLYAKICEKVKEVAGVQKVDDDDDDDDDYAGLKADPEFMAQALLFSKKRKTTTVEACKDDEIPNDGAINSANNNNGAIDGADSNDPLIYDGNTTNY